MSLLHRKVFLITKSVHPCYTLDRRKKQNWISVSNNSAQACQEDSFNSIHVLSKPDERAKTCGQPLKRAKNTARRPGLRSESPPLGVCCSPCPSQCWAPCSYSASGTSPSSLCEESANHQPLLPADGCVSPFHLLITKDQPVSFYLVNTALPGSVFCYISNSYKQKPCVEGDLSTSTTLFLFREPTCAQRRSVACHHPVTRHLHR